MTASNSTRWEPPSSAAELDALVQRITTQVVAEFGNLASVGTAANIAPWPLAELLSCGPDRLGAMPAWSVLDARGSRTRADSPPKPADGARALASIIDHTLLKPDVTPQQIVALCEDASEHGFRTVCVNPCHVALASRELGRRRRGDAAPGVCAVVGFPLGATLSDVKAFEARRAVEEGATEIDMVLSIGLLKARRDGYVVADIAEVVRAVPRGMIVKVILETCLLTEEEKRQACRLAREAGAGFVKTSTGFSTGGATPADVRLMREEVGRALGVKASGGIRTEADAWTMVLNGATRIGASASVAIVSGATSSPNSGY